MERTSNKFLKVTGILMIIGGGIGIIVSILAVIGVAALAAYVGSEANLGLLVVSAVISLVSSVISLVAGILGVANAAKPEKAKTCIIFGVLAIVLSILGNIMTVAGGGTFSPTSLVIGLFVPALYLIGAFQSSKNA